MTNTLEPFASKKSAKKAEIAILKYSIRSYRLSFLKDLQATGLQLEERLSALKSDASSAHIFNKSSLLSLHDELSTLKFSAKLPISSAKYSSNPSFPP